MPILILAKGFPPTAGGVETYSACLASAYARLGTAVTVVTSCDGPTGWRDVQLSDGSTVRLWNAGSTRQTVFLLRVLYLLVLRERHLGAHTVHATTWRMGAPAILIGRHRRLIISAHGREFIGLSPALRRLCRLVLGRADLILAVSHFTSMRIVETFPTLQTSRTTWRHNGLSPSISDSIHTSSLADTERFTAMNSDQCRTLRLLSVSRLVRRKNLHSLIEAVAKLNPATRERIHLTIAGTGPELSNLKALAEELGISEQVSFAGFVSDALLPELYRRAHVFCHPHAAQGDAREIEGFGIAIADAMAMGCVPLVGHEGAPSDYIVSESTGFLVDGADVDDMAKTLQRIAELPAEELNNIALDAREFALANFSWDQHAAHALEKIEDCG